MLFNQSKDKTFVHVSLNHKSLKTCKNVPIKICDEVTQNIPRCVKYARILVFSNPYFPILKHRIEDSALMQENKGQRKPVF